MAVVQTKNFKLGVYSQGDENSPRQAIVIPGLLDTKDYPHMRSHVDHLAAKGFYAISPDMPGIWDSGEDINEYSMTNCLKAIDELIEYFGKPTLLVGHSLGGRLASLASVRNPRVFAFVAIMSAATFVRPSNYEDRKVNWKKDGVKVSLRDLPGNAEQKRQFDLPFSFCEDADNYDARDGLADLAIPKLFIAGANDTTVLPEEVQQSYDSAGEPKQLITIESDHNYRRQPELIEVVNKILEKFIDSLDSSQNN